MTISEAGARVVEAIDTKIARILLGVAGSAFLMLSAYELSTTAGNDKAIGRLGDKIDSLERANSAALGVVEDKVDLLAKTMDDENRSVEAQLAALADKQATLGTEEARLGQAAEDRAALPSRWAPPRPQPFADLPIVPQIAAALRGLSVRHARPQQNRSPR